MMKTILQWILSFCMMISSLPMFSSCGEYSAHGFDEYFEEQGSSIHMGTSSVEIDQFGAIYPLYTDYSYIDGDYYFQCKESLPFYNILERAIVYFEYEESDYQAAKAYCLENLPTLGETVTESYNGYQFYDIYGNRDKEEFYHGNNYPRAFKRVAFQEEKNVILFIGVYASDKRAETLAQDLQDWGTFLQKYFSEYYSFDN